MPNRKSTILNRTSISIFFALLVAFLSIPAFGVGIKYKTSGTYIDGAGGQHAWSINDGHTLLWESNPYIPAGVVFTASSLAPKADDAAYQADVKSLGALKSQGITDIILKGPGPITASSPDALQKIVSYLDSNGFAYGVEMDDGPVDGLQGYAISPSRYRLEGPSEKTTITCSWPDADSAMYVVLSRFDNTIKLNGGGVVSNGKVTVALDRPLRADEILMVYPHRSFKPDQMGDLWGGYNEYRDRLLAYFKGVKFGTGLRFLIEPFTSKLDFTGEMAGFLPDSAGFRVGLEAFLTRKYKHEGGLNAGWGVNENLDTIERATKLVPLWAQGRGAPFLYDRASAQFMSVNPAVSGQVWQDIIDYRDLSAQEFMNSISEALRKQVANVPVIFKGSTYARIYSNPFATGFDGLAAQARGTGEAAADRLVGPLYSLAEESGKSTWFVAAGIRASEDGKTPFGGETSMAATLDSLREIGCKGFFLEDAGQAGWLTSFKGRIGKNWTDFKPQVIPFPNDPPTGAYVKRLANDTWWLPTLRRGTTTYIGDNLFAYSIVAEGKSYLWSGTGKQAVVMNTTGAGTPAVEYPIPANLPSKKNGTFTLNLDDSPTVVRGINFNQVFPRDTAQQELDRLARLIPMADKAGIDVKKARGDLASAITVLKNNQSAIAFQMAQDALADLEKKIGSLLWLEGEKSAAANFGSIIAAPGASGALALVLDTDQDPPMMPYSVTYNFDASTTASFEVWFAATPPADGSPASYAIDGAGWTTLTAADNKTDSYAPGLAWYKVTTANLTAGSHTITVRADSRRSQDNRYYFAIDAIVLSPRAFTPNGIVKGF